MHYGIEVVPFGEYADPRKILELALTAEQSGWEGLWVWDHLLMPYGAGDPWVTLSAIAACTHRLKLIPGVAAIPRYHPHLLARFINGLDRLSQGRVILGAGAGAIGEEFSSFGGPSEPRTRAEMLDESLQVITSLASGAALDFHGKYYTVNGVNLLPTPIQQPHVPVWIGGESPAALRRAARWEGWMIGTVNERSEITRTPQQLRQEVDVIRSDRQDKSNFDVAIDGISQPGDTNLVDEYAGAGATWWFEILFGLRGSHEEMIERVQAGPPR